MAKKTDSDQVKAVDGAIAHYENAMGKDYPSLEFVYNVIPRQTMLIQMTLTVEEFTFVMKVREIYDEMEASLAEIKRLAPALKERPGNIPADLDATDYDELEKKTAVIVKKLTGAGIKKGKK